MSKKSTANTIPVKQYHVSTKGNIQLPGKTGVSPKVIGQAFHKFRSPSYTEQQITASNPLLKPKHMKKGTDKIMPKQ